MDLMPPRTPPDADTALRIASELQKQAALIDDPQLRKLLLSSSCRILDAALKRHRIPTPPVQPAVEEAFA
jgi:hypothetical protein